MLALRSRVETWVRDQTARMEATWQEGPGGLLLRGWKKGRQFWPPWRGREAEKRRLREEFERRRSQFKELCQAVKVETVTDLQEVLCCMVLAECVYKRPASEMIKYINKFKSDFGAQVSLERVQPSLDHVPHRYLLAEAGDTLFASFIGTKQYRDVMADINILQGAIFHEDSSDEIDISDNNEFDDENLGNLAQGGKPKRLKTPKPAAHKGFLARAKGIPALELYNLAKKKNRKLVLCGHSLGGAVAVLATLAILRVVASSLSKENGKLQVKCITFSQPPVGNAALRDYVHQKGWENYFKTYCIPEDVVPRILSPAYFHHYNNNNNSPNPEFSPLNNNNNNNINNQPTTTITNNTTKQLVLGVGPVQTSFWRLSKLVPLEGVRKTVNVIRKFGGKNGENLELKGEEEGEAQTLEIREGSQGISLAPLPEVADVSNGERRNGATGGEDSTRQWGKVPSLPSYIPFGQLYLLGDSSVKSLSDSEYSKMTSVRSVITELKDRLQSHSMRSYRSRFQKIYDLYMGSNISPFVGMDQLPQFSHLQQLLGLSAVESVELGHIVEPPVIRTASSILPLGWTGKPSDRGSDPLKVDVVGHGLHLCTLVQAYLNGNWCSTAVESLPTNHELHQDLQKMRIIVGPALKKPPKYPITEESLLPPLTECTGLEQECNRKASSDGLDSFIIYCTSDFVTVRKEVHVRARRVRFIGLEGSGKSSLFRAVIGQYGEGNSSNHELIHPHSDNREAVSGGLCYLDSNSIKLQDLNSEAIRFREEIQTERTDLLILVHNLSHRIPYNPIGSNSNSVPSLSLLINEAELVQIPWILALTNKFSVSTHQYNALINYAIEAYRSNPSLTAVVNSIPFFTTKSMSGLLEGSGRTEGAPSSRRFLPAVSLSLKPFQRKDSVLPIEGVGSLREIVHTVLRNNEERAFQELSDERLTEELKREREATLHKNSKPPKNDNSITAAAVGASLGAGLGLVMAVIMGAASALRKP